MRRHPAPSWHIATTERDLALHYLHGPWPKLVRFLENGAWHARANLYSLIKTAKANNIEPYRYLVALFKKLPLAQCVDDDEALLPWNIHLREP